MNGFVHVIEYRDICILGILGRINGCDGEDARGEVENVEDSANSISESGAITVSRYGAPSETCMFVAAVTMMSALAIQGLTARAYSVNLRTGLAIAGKMRASIGRPVVVCVTVASHSLRTSCCMASSTNDGKLSQFGSQSRD